MSIDELLKKAILLLNQNKIEDSNLKAKILLMHVLNVSKEYLLINKNKIIDEQKINEYKKFIKRLCEYEPIQYITNHQEFYGLDFYVDNNVLIPQPDTETLVEEVLKILLKDKKLNNEKIKILDLCTGSGAIGITLAKKIKNSEVILSDISDEALKIAGKNANLNEVNLKIIKSNLFNNIQTQKFDIIVSNPPYIETNVIKSLSEEVKKEPKIALDGGVDGLEFYKKISKDAKDYLNECGYLALEIGYNQKKAVMEILLKDNYKNIYCKKDLGFNDRVIVAQI